MLCSAVAKVNSIYLSVERPRIIKQEQVEIYGMISENLCNWILIL